MPSLPINESNTREEMRMTDIKGAIYPDLEGKGVLITGGGSGIGESIVHHFARQKAKVAFIDINVEAGKKVAADCAAKGWNVHFEPCDLTNIPALQAAVKNCRAAIGPITVLINNAAHDQRHKMEDVTSEYWDERFATNLKHQFFCAQAVIDDMKAANDGVIINFGSTSWMVGQGGMAAYTAAKSGVLGLTRSLARDFGQWNIRCNAIAPGWIMTERQKTLWLTPEGEKELMIRQCLKRKLVPADIAKVTVFLSSSEAEAMTNQQYVVDGGWV